MCAAASASSSCCGRINHSKENRTRAHAHTRIYVWVLMMMIIRSQCARVACVRSWMISFSFLSVIIKIAPICLWSFFYMWPAALRVVVHLINTIWAVANKTRSLIINSDRKHRASLFIWNVTLLARARSKNMCVWSRKIIYCCECVWFFFLVWEKQTRINGRGATLICSRSAKAGFALNTFSALCRVVCALYTKRVRRSRRHICHKCAQGARIVYLI